MNKLKQFYILVFLLFFHGCDNNREGDQLEFKEFPIKSFNESVEEVLIYKLNKDVTYSGLFNLKNKNKFPNITFDDQVKAQEVYNYVLNLYDENAIIVRKEDRKVKYTPYYLIYFPSKDGGQRLVLWVYRDFFRLAINPQVKFPSLWISNFELPKQKADELLKLLMIPTSGNDELGSNFKN